MPHFALEDRKKENMMKSESEGESKKERERASINTQLGNYTQTYSNIMYKNKLQKILRDKAPYGLYQI